MHDVGSGAMCWVGAQCQYPQRVDAPAMVGDMLCSEEDTWCGSSGSFVSSVCVCVVVAHDRCW